MKVEPQPIVTPLNDAVGAPLDHAAVAQICSAQLCYGRECCTENRRNRCFLARFFTGVFKANVVGYARCKNPTLILMQRRESYANNN
jgi:hypothetical protein